jgi:type I restriction enzyme S subunit
MPKDIIEGRIEEKGVARVSAEHVERLSRHKLRAGDIVYGRRGDIGRQALIRPEQDGWICGTGCLRLSLGDLVLNPLFLHYYLQQNEVVSWITNQAVGATMPNLNTGILRSVPVRFPPLPLQRRIAGILSAYDELIENSQRRIKILEGMARALYREWFVHFRFPGHESVPRVPSPLGEIPEGWEVKRVPNCVSINPRITVPRDGEKPFVPMGCLSNDSMLISDIESRTGNSGAKFQNGDTLFARITPCLENGKTGFVQFLPDAEAVAFGSTEFIVLRSLTLTPEFVYCLARSEEFRGVAIKSMSGATGRQRVQEKCFDDLQIAHPPLTLLEEFSAIVAPSFRLIYRLHHQIHNLRRTRDLLLPRLLSGQIDVEEMNHV